MDEQLLQAIAEIQQPRSEFQLHNFVIGQHDTEEMRYYQCLLEINDLVYKYKSAKLVLKKQEIKIARLRAKQDELADVKADELELGLEQTKLAMIGAERELLILVSFWESCPIKYTRQEIESAQPDYWKARLTRQAELQAVGSGQVEWAQLDALRQADELDGFMNNYLESMKAKQIQ